MAENNNCTIAAICASVKPLASDSKIQLVIIVLQIVNALITMAAPLFAKSRAVQEVVFPQRTQNRKEIKQKLNTAIEAMQDAVRTMSQRSDSDQSNDALPAKKKSIDVLG
jgi:signal transduction protein with GAF and PtsI domain